MPATPKPRAKMGFPLDHRLLVGLVILGLTWPAPGRVAASPGARFVAVESPAWVKTNFTPAALKGEEHVKVIVRMSADPVALVRARAPNRVLSDAEEAATVSRAHAQHEAIAPGLTALGARVLGHFHYAFNGVKVEIARGAIARLASLPGVVEAMPVRTYHLNNAVSVPFIGAPLVWQATPGFRGEGIKIALIDTGIDYTHADFGGPGTVAAFTAAQATSTQPADPSLFGPNAPKVKGGTDLVGDDYDANDPAKSTPVPDPNPLDCNGHGSHVAGTAAGFGVLQDGRTFGGPYDVSAYADNAFLVGPGVAPKADLYAVRVFGCSGATDVVTEAIDWTVEHKMDVVNMSLGSDFGLAISADSIAAANAAKAGILVVAAAGNAGPGLYVTGEPAVAEGVVSVAAMDSTAAFPAAVLALSTGGSVTVQNSNGGALLNGTSYPGVVVLRNTGFNGEPNDGSLSFGCQEADWDKTRNGGVDVAGKLVVALRGTATYCDQPSAGARVFRAGAGQKYGAAAVVLLNNAPGYPPFEGQIPGGDPTTNPFGAVTIPFYGAQGASTPTAPSPDAAAIIAAASATATNSSIANPGFELTASFSSGGPAQIDSGFKPSLAAPGVSILSTLSGSGYLGVRLSGTSMATPHVTGVAALARQAHPTWSSQDQRASVLQTATLSLFRTQNLRLGGAGVVQPVGATLTQAVVLAPDDQMNPLAFGEAEMLHPFVGQRELTIRNHGRTAIDFSLSSSPVSGGPVTVGFSRKRLRVPPGGDAKVVVTLAVPTSSVGPTHDPSSGAVLFQEVSGFVTLTPGPGQNGGVTLSLPYYLVPRVRSNAFSFTGHPLGPSHPQNTLYVTNFGGATPAVTDFYNVGLVSDPQGLAFFDPHALGVQEFPSTATDNYLVFALNTWNRFNNPAVDEIDICVFTTQPAGPCDAVSTLPDFMVIGIGGSVISAQLPIDQMVAAVFNPATGQALVRFFADAPTDGSTVLLPVLASDLGLSATTPSFSYTAATFDENLATASLPGVGAFNAFNQPITVSAFPVVAPDTFVPVGVHVDPAQFAATPQLGLMVIVPDNRADQREGQVVRIDGVAGD